ncbi:MAG TPA: hypothetical protein VNA11_21005, partial [Pseudonocardia sp.]|nr:hypothetical protein [Pseudonocardia sp.]
SGPAQVSHVEETRRIVLDDHGTGPHRQLPPGLGEDGQPDAVQDRRQEGLSRYSDSTTVVASTPERIRSSTTACMLVPGWPAINRCRESAVSGTTAPA